MIDDPEHIARRRQPPSWMMAPRAQPPMPPAAIVIAPVAPPVVAPVPPPVARARRGTTERFSDGPVDNPDGKFRPWGMPDWK